MREKEISKARDSERMREKEREQIARNFSQPSRDKDVYVSPHKKKYKN